MKIWEMDLKDTRTIYNDEAIGVWKSNGKTLVEIYTDEEIQEVYTIYGLQRIEFKKEEQK